MILNRFPDKKTFIELAEKSNVIPVCTEILADMETPVSILRKFYVKEEPIFLLESVEGGERWARYSFIGTSAKSHIRIFSDHIEIFSGIKNTKIFHKGDPLKILENIMDQYHPAPVKDLPRFWCGLTGYITYEMASFFESIPVSLPESQPYAHFIIADSMIIFDNIKQTLTCIRICYTKDKSDYSDIFDNASTELDKMIRKIQNSSFRGTRMVDADVALKAETDPEIYIQGVKKIKDYIINGDIIQAVYSQPFSCTVPVDPIMLYRAQRYINPSPYMFFMNFKDITIAGSSPETMVRLENRTATLRPIAGTRKRGFTEQEDINLADELLKDEKERAEHLMLVDLGRNDLGRIAEPGSVQVTDMMFVERYSHVMHLVSNISCDIKQGLNAWDLLRATFPAGTLSGAPKIRAMEIISGLEKKPRGVYGGAAGYISFSGNMDLAITIRTAVMENGKMTIQAGAGIVADSVPEKELEECINKAKSVEHALKLAMSGTGDNRYNP